MGSNESKGATKKSKSKSSQEPATSSSTAEEKSNQTVKRSAELSVADIEFLEAQTGLLRSDIKSIFDKFNLNNPDDKLDKKEFVRLYESLRPEPHDILDEISEHVFRCFDSDQNGSISFNEFLIAYALTSRGDLTKKLDYAFNMYDLDGNGYLDKNELSTVLYGMLDMLGAERKNHDVAGLGLQCLKDLDTSNDGKVTKDEFISGLLKNYSLRALMSPFN